MKTTYLLREEQPDGSVCMVETTSEVWHAIVKADAVRPRCERRFFIYDIIPDEGGLDCMVIEVTWDEWKEWDNKQRAVRRSNERKREISFLSLDCLIEDGDRDQFYERMLIDDIFETEVISNRSIDGLRAALREWNPWGVELMEYYIAGEKTSCTKAIAMKYEVSEQTARKYKRQFEDFVKKYFSKVFRF